ncbi:hypothetical protein J2X31_002539 [Flavobacterium arsenatis]|uniref:RagB/SusD family nutrient uptake outer membrane protein n=1 Tax=Flavobacterium arsenatis TaxID=1484332 RepID=A0ABU1TRM0_9FLAO|nr:RagB/SusD family nutrient uptake outer membrane protein [Flavobacterium arsenatis]MDR6968516.1 hypothetical protein [Flavobacterium arsenatis]
MKFIKSKILILTSCIALSLAACSDDILEEQPRSILEPGFFQTEKGVLGGLTSMYAHLRYIYGPAYYYNTLVTGTDEATYAQSADNNFKDMDMTGVGSITSSSSRSDALWGTAFSNINTANGVIEYAGAVGISESLIAEAKFFRAFDYFLLAQTFGGVPLDLGSGELRFNVSPSRTSVRNTVPEVYTRCVFPDLLQAIEELPAGERIKGSVTKTVARLYLSKAYLTYGWWLENPNNVPTYPETTRVDPDGHDAQWYYQQAYNVALEGIDNPGPYSLQETFYDVNLGSNDRNSELMLYADHTEKSEFYNASSLSYANGAAPDNFAGWMMTWNYTNIRSSGVSSVQRAATQPLGRPWTRMCPTIGVLKNTFADKTNDSRYDGTFVTTYRGNWNKGGNTSPTLVNANGLSISPGDAVLTFLNEDNPAVVYDAATGGIGAGLLPGRADYVIEPGAISRIVYPGLWKLGPFRTDNGDGLGQPNAASTRPYNIAKFSEFYFIAAEAAVKGAATTGGRDARALINVIRARAGKWRFDNNGNVVKNEDNSAAMIAATPGVIDINYILAERSREYYAEGYRWFDLVRTQKWEELAGTYQICGPTYGDHTPQTFTRTIEKYFYLRPIPIGQLDAMMGTPQDKATYQNPGYL